MHKELKTVDFTNLVLGENCRIPNMEHIPELAEDIAAVGLKQALLVTPKGEQFRVLQGNRRYKAIARIKENNPGRFKELFGKGIPTAIVTGISDEEMVDLIIDHGQIQGLNDPMELQLAANMLFAAGKTERQVVVALSGLLEKFTPMKADVRKEWLAKLEQVKIAREAGQFEWAVQLQNEAEAFLLNNRRGKIQNLHNAFRCPDIVMQALWYKATGELHPDTPADFKNTMPKGLTYAHVNQLYKAFKNDLESDEEGLVTKANPGSQFWAKWQEICEKLQQAAKEKLAGKKRPKAMNATDMMKDVEEGTWSSQGFRRLTEFHAGKSVDKTELAKMDAVCHTAEIIKDGDPDLWQNVVDTAQAIINERRAAAMEKAAQAKVAKPRKRKKIRK